VDDVGGGSARYEDEISLLDVASVVLRQRRLIVVSTVVGMLLALVMALTTPLEFTASASFLPHGGDQGGLSGAAGLAAQFGFSIPRSGNAERSPEFYQDLLQSREILDAVVRSGVEVPSPAGASTIDLVEHFDIEAETLAERNALMRRHLAEEVVSVSVGRETGVVTVSITTDDRDLSAAIGHRLLELIGTFDVETRQSQASAERSFAEERLEQLREELTTAEDLLQSFLDENRQFSNSPQLTFAHDRLQRRVAMRQDLFTAMAQAYEQARIDEVRNTPVITVIDQPEAPALPDPRGRLLKLVLGLTLGMMAGFGLAFAREFGERERSGQSVAYRDFQHVISDVKSDPFGLSKASRPTTSPTPPEV
jgi:uncharacterized protein involved in exopolysaccharide biosynthesis